MTLNDRIKNELLHLSEPIDGMPNLVRALCMKCMYKNQNYFQVRSGGHDRWTNGTAQHCWRVYQYMLYMKQHPHCLASDEIKNPAAVAMVPDWAIAITALLHDWGNINGKDNHEITSVDLINQYLQPTNSQEVDVLKATAAIYFHHHKDKHHRKYDPYRGGLLSHMLRKADGWASGTTWNSTRFNNRVDQVHRERKDMRYLCAEALDRTIQVTKYGVYLDNYYNCQELYSYKLEDVDWKGDCSGEEVMEVNAVHLLDLLIRTNIVRTFFYCKSSSLHHHHYETSMLRSLCAQWNVALSGKGIYLPNVCFFRGKQEDGYPMITPEYHNVLIIN